MVREAESLLKRRGFPVCRVRHHGSVARIEVPVTDLQKLFAQPLRGEVDAALRALGYGYVCVDLAGFRSGSLNEALPRES